jgi:hypothetical protein
MLEKLRELHAVAVDHDQHVLKIHTARSASGNLEASTMEKTSIVPVGMRAQIVLPEKVQNDICLITDLSAHVLFLPLFTSPHQHRSR